MKIAELRKICQSDKLRRNTGLTLFNRLISIYFTRLFIGLNVSANQISVSSTMIGVLGSILFIPGIWQLNILGVVLLYVSFTFDQVDGELARYYQTVNLNGVYLDELRHLIIYAITIFSLSFPAARELDSYLMFLLGFMGAISLTISRVEERLPYQIFAEKIILKDNFSGGTFNERDSSESLELESKSKERVASSIGWKKLKRFLATIFYNGFQVLSDQVTIIIWLLMVTLVDRFVLGEQKIFGGFSVQSLFFIVFSLYGPTVLIKVIHGHFGERKVERVCSGIYNVMKKMPNNF